MNKQHALLIFAAWLCLLLCASLHLVASHIAGLSLWIGSDIELASDTAKSDPMHLEALRFSRSHYRPLRHIIDSCPGEETITVYKAAKDNHDV